MMHHQPLIALTLAIGFALGSAGCSVLASNDDQTKKLEQKLEVLKNKYARKTKDIKRVTKEKRKEVETSIKRQDIQRTIVPIDDPYDYTHPCGEDGCTKDQGTYKHGRDYIFEEEDIDRQEDFIEASMEQALALSQKTLKAREYGMLEVALAKADKQWRHDTSSQEQLVEVRDSLQKTWLEDVTKRAQSHEQALPGVALIEYAKAMQLAKAQGDRKALASLNAKRGALRTRMLNAYVFDVRLAEASGEVAGQVAGLLLGARRKKMIRVWRDAPATLDGTMKIRTQPPAFRVFDTRASGSFRYTNGTKQVKNDAYKELRNKEKYYVYLANHCGSECGGTGTCAYRSYSNWLGRGGGTELSHSACSVASSAHSKAISYRSQASSMGPYKTVTNYDQYSYPYTLHHHTAQAKLGVDLQVTGLRPIQRSPMGAAAWARIPSRSPAPRPFRRRSRRT